MTEQSESAEALERARAAFAKGRIGPSVRYGWSAALAAIHERDAEQLGAVLVLARWVEEQASGRWRNRAETLVAYCSARSEEHTSELQSRPHLVCRLLLAKKKTCNLRRTH